MRSYIDILADHARQQPERIAYRFLAAGEEPSEELGFAELDRRARAVAAALQRRGLSGRRVLLLHTPGIDYVVSLIGCLYARSVAVPAYPPGRTAPGRTMERIQAIVRDADVTHALVGDALAATLRDEGTHPEAFSRLAVLTPGEVDADAGASWDAVAPAGHEAALLQYTSGSTGKPRGVLVSHDNLVANLRMLLAASELDAQGTVVSWLPPYHDMGLVGGILTPAFAGATSILMAPQAFLRRPLRWLRAVDRYRATVTPAPNFALDLCVKRSNPAERAELDLSCLRVLLTGAEPVRADSIERFCEAFAVAGLRRNTIYPCYGMAEATLIISGGRAMREPVVREVSQDALCRGRFEPPGRSRDAAQRLVGCGSALLQGRIRVVDPESRRPLPDGHVGEIWTSGPGVARGYWNRPDETEQTFGARLATGEGTFLRTGDLGVLHDGELFVTGRLKDLVLIHGLNHYPQDIETTVQQGDPACIRDAGAAFTRTCDQGERLLVVQEFDTRIHAPDAAIVEYLAESIRRDHGLAVAEIVLIRRGSLPKTSSGKVMRGATDRALRAEQLPVLLHWKSRAGVDESGERPLSPTPWPPNRAAILEWLRQRVAQHAGLPANDVDPTAALAQYGLDSLANAEISEALEQWLRRPLPPTVTFDHPTLERLAAALDDTQAPANAQPSMLLPPPPPGQPARGRARRTTPHVGHTSDREPIALVGMACRVPGANSPEALWQLFVHGTQAIEEVPRSRWNLDSVYAPARAPGKMVSRRGGFLESVDRFDAAFFGISPHEAARMDPQQRIFLEVAWEALEDAGLPPLQLAGSHTGVFVGACGSDYADLLRHCPMAIDADFGAGVSPGVIPNRLSHFLDLRGPSLASDAACASGLVALEQAQRALVQRDCDLAIVGATNLLLTPETSIFFSQANLLSPDGVCKSFDAGANGVVRSEAVVALVFKRLSRAQADADRIRSVVCSVAVNHNGRSNGLMAPHAEAQREVIESALARAGVTAHELDYLEGHGVGTPLADAVELRVLREVMGDRDPSQPCIVGSTKPNLGHTEAASGLVGLLRTTLALEHELIPPHPTLREVSPLAGLDAAPLAIPVAPVDWARSGRPRFAGVSAFGFGGTNAHAVVREAPATTAGRHAATERSAQLLLLSARSRGSLASLCQRVARSLATRPLGDVAHTLAVGRSHLAYRVALQARDPADASRSLEAIGRAFAQAPECWPPVDHPAGTRARAGQVAPGARTRAALVFGSSLPSPEAVRALHDGEPVFRNALEHAARQLDRHLDSAICAGLLGQGVPGPAAAAAFALQRALHELLQHWGLPVAEAHGREQLVGELAALCAQGVLGWDTVTPVLALGVRIQEALRRGDDPPQSPAHFASRLGALLRDAADADAEARARRLTRLLFHGPGGATPLSPTPADAGLVTLQLCDEARNPPGDLVLLDGNPDPWPGLLDAVARMHVLGVELNWARFDEPYVRNRVSLPSYPFLAERHWFPEPVEPVMPAGPTRGRASSHPLIDRIVTSAPPPHSVVVPRYPKDETG